MGRAGQETRLSVGQTNDGDCVDPAHPVDRVDEPSRRLVDGCSRLDLSERVELRRPRRHPLMDLGTPRVLLAEQPLNAGHELLGPEGLAQDVVGPGAQPRGGLVVARDEQHRERRHRGILTQGRKQAVAIGIQPARVDHDGAWAGPGDHVERPAPVGDLAHV
jgi:hypothetical protein